MSVKVRSYLSPTLVLLAFDWPEAPQHQDFLGFAIKRTPGFREGPEGLRSASSWLPNRLRFGDASSVAHSRSASADTPSNAAPIQKFSWWDARFDDADRQHTFRYDVYPVTGTPDALTVRTGDSAMCSVTLPSHTVDGIGTWFNRAVVSSQAFSRKVAALRLAPGASPAPADALALRHWLANGMEDVFDTVLAGASRTVGAVYHLTDTLWALPALASFGKAHGKEALAIVYDAKQVAQKGKAPAASPNQVALDALDGLATLCPRDKTHIMHDKFLVSDGPNANAVPMRLLAGSANFTTEGLTEQANVLHVFDAPPLATLYNDRAHLLAGNPPIAATAKAAPGWSSEFAVGTAQVRACFSPEPGTAHNQIDTIVEAIGKARDSVMFCLFMPTDATLRQACFDAGDKGLTMFGLVNHISAVKSTGTGDETTTPARPPNASALANLALYHRSQHQRDVIDAAHFTKDTTPDGFLPEWQLFPGEKAPPYTPVIIHHKFIIIDAEGDNPIVYSGSANMSKNSEQYNDENLLEIRDKRIAAIYLAEFLRLYEHYRARAIALTERRQSKNTPTRLQLVEDASWSKKYYIAGSPEQKSRIDLSSEGP